MELRVGLRTRRRKEGERKRSRKSSINVAAPLAKPCMVEHGASARKEGEWMDCRKREREREREDL